MPINLEERLKRADEYQQRKNKMKKLFFYDWFLKQNKKKQRGENTIDEKSGDTTERR